MLLSLILPTYNVEAYLGKCINSCLRQDLTKSDYEIIVVIDGSPDNSLDIAKEFQEKNSNVKVVFRENGGLSVARNTGLAVATGEFVWFIDSDDYIKENILAGIVGRLKDNKLDSLWIGWQDVDRYGNVEPPFAPHAYSNNLDVMSGKDFMAKVLSNYLYAWSFIYRRTFLKENNLFFTEGMFYEDTDFAFRSLPLVGRIQFYDKVCYNYLQRNGSIVHHTNMKKLEDICRNCISASKSMQKCEEPLKRFYKICFSANYIFFLKEVLKSEYISPSYIIEQTKLNHFGKVRMYGDLKTNIIGLTYNLLGIELCCFVFGVLIKLYRCLTLFRPKAIL